MEITELNERSREIFRHIVDAYVETGEPIGSRTISRRMGLNLSPATIRNVMADLEDCGLLFSPHTSAGRLPTEVGMRLFVHGLLEVGGVGAEERRSIEAQCAASGRSLAEVLEEATTVLSGLSRCAGLVVAPKTDRPLRHMEFVNLGPGRMMVVLVTEDGLVENRIVEVPATLPPASLEMASNFINYRIAGRTLAETRGDVLREIEQKKAELDELTSRVVEAGFAIWSGDPGGQLIIRGQGNLLDDVTALEDLERIRSLFDAMETREQMIKLLDAANRGEGVQIFVGAENDMFNHAGCSMIVAPYMNAREQIVGAIGVIGPTRVNYARIIPMVDYTAKVVSRLIG